MKAEIVKAEFAVDMLTITKLHTQAQTEAQGLSSASIDNDEDAADAAEHLRDWLRKLDQVVAMQKDTLAPIREAEKRIKGLFKPLLDAGDSVTNRVRRMLEEYELMKRFKQRAALAEAQAAAAASEPEALLEALTAVEDATSAKLEGTAFVRSWVVKRIGETLLPDEYWVVDLKRIEKIGAAEHGDSPPAIPGVVWEEKLSSRVRR